MLKSFALPLLFLFILPPPPIDQPVPNHGATAHVDEASDYSFGTPTKAGERMNDSQQGDTLLAAPSDKTVRIGAGRGHSTVQVGKAGANVTGTFSINGRPIHTAAIAPTGRCSVVAWTLSDDGHITFCDGTSFLRKF